MPRWRGLSPKQEAFAQNIADGKGPTESYLAAGYRSNKAVVSIRACEEKKKPKVAARIAELKKPREEARAMSREYKRRRLYDFVDSAKSSELDGERLKAIDLDNRMAGHNEPELIALSGLGSVLQKIRASAKKP